MHAIPRNATCAFTVDDRTEKRLASLLIRRFPHVEREHRVAARLPHQVSVMATIRDLSMTAASAGTRWSRDKCA